MVELMVFRIVPDDIDVDELKCGYCNWRVYRVWVLASSKEDAIKLVESGDAGLCGECMMELFEKIGRKIVVE